MPAADSTPTVGPAHSFVSTPTAGPARSTVSTPTVGLRDTHWDSFTYAANADRPHAQQWNVLDRNL